MKTQIDPHNVIQHITCLVPLIYFETCTYIILVHEINKKQYFPNILTVIGQKMRLGTATQWALHIAKK